jgi:hypothetical protein
VGSATLLGKSPRTGNILICLLCPICTAGIRNSNLSQTAMRVWQCHCWWLVVQVDAGSGCETVDIYTFINVLQS